MTVAEAQAKMSSSEFSLWCVYLSEKLYDHEKLDYYLAALTAEVRRSWVKKPRKIKDADFLVKFKKSPTKKTMTSQDREAHIKHSKASWGAALGIKIPGAS